MLPNAITADLGLMASSIILPDLGQATISSTLARVISSSLTRVISSTLTRFISSSLTPDLGQVGISSSLTPGLGQASLPSSLTRVTSSSLTGLFTFVFISHFYLHLSPVSSCNDDSKHVTGVKLQHNFVIHDDGLNPNLSRLTSS